MHTTAELRDRFQRSLLSLDRLRARSVMDECLASSSPSEVVDDLIVPVLDDLGEQWSRGDLALSEVYMAARITEQLLVPLFSEDDEGDEGDTPAAVCVLEDYHALGKKMVLGSLRCAGVHVVDLGHGLTVDEVVDAVKERGFRVLLVSVLMLRSALRVKDLMQRLADEGLDVKVVVGGAPFRLDPTLADEVGAHAWARSATEAPRLVKEWAVA